MSLVERHHKERVDGIGEPATELSREADVETEDLGNVCTLTGDREGEVECNRRRAQHWNGHARSKTGRRSEGPIRDGAVHRTKVAEDHAADVLGGSHREHVFHSSHGQEGTADVNSVLDGTHAAELESAKVLISPRESSFKDRRVVAGEAQLRRQREDMLSLAVRALAKGEELLPSTSKRL